jgi:ribosomal-protein-alanine N-acetyltransferase
MSIIETSRFYLREFKPSDAENLYRLNRDPEVMKYTGDLPFDSVEAAARFLRHYRHYRKYGYGRWAVIQKSDEAFMGWCGLKFTAGLDEIDIGFRFLRSTWNRGIATESAAGCIRYGFESLGLDRILGRAMKDNPASVSVLENIGLQFLKDFDFDGHDGVIYYIDKPGG